MSAAKPPFADSLATLGWGGPQEHRDRNDRPSYVGPVSFSQLPWIEDATEIRRMGADVAIIGAPFDDAVTHRPGTRFGPRAIREAQYQTGVLHSLQVGVDPFRILNYALNVDWLLYSTPRYGARWSRCCPRNRARTDS